MANLTGVLNQPFLVAITAATGLTVAVDVTLPNGDPGPTLTLDDSNGDGIYSATFTPTVVGVYTLTVDSPGNPSIDDVAIGLTVDPAGPTFAGAAHNGQLCPPVDGQAIRWPCPDLARLPCITQYSPDSILYWTAVATEDVYGVTAARFPGCDLYARLRPAVTSCCLSPVAGSWGYDLHPDVGWPILELVAVEVDGEDQDLADWSIEQRRYLVPGPGIGWPLQDGMASAGDAGAWSVTVRYGRPAPRLVLAARDRYMLQLLYEMEPTTGGQLACQLEPGTINVAENGRTMTFDPERNAQHGEHLMKRIRAKWGRRATTMSRMADPTRPATRWVPGDHTPTPVAVFAPSGCDLQAQLDQIAAGA